MRSRRFPAALALAVALLLPAQAVAATPSGDDTRVVGSAAQTDAADLSTVAVRNGDRALSVSLAYAQRATGDYPLIVTTVKVDTRRSHHGPEFVLLMNNQCGNGWTFSRPGAKDDADWYGGDCGGEPGKCFPTITVDRDDDGYLNGFRVVKRSGCFTAGRLRLNVDVATLYLGGGQSSSSHDYLPGKKSFTPWVAPGRSRTFNDS